jgi:uncharacterized phage protein gp47/JayE
MSLPVQTTQALADTMVAQLEASIGQTVPFLPKTFCRVLAKVQAGVFVILYRYAGFIFLQLFVAHASMKETIVNGKTIRPLVEWGRLLGVDDPRDATRADLVVQVTVLNQVGTLATASPLLRTDTGIVYETVGDVALNAPTIQVTIRAVQDQDGNGGVGTIGNLNPGDTVRFANAAPNVGQDVTVLSQSVNAEDAETESSYRARVFGKARARPQGGAYADYRQWGETVAGILNIYPYAGDPGEIDIYVEATVASSGDPDGIPTGAQLSAVADAIQLDVAGQATRRPVNAGVNHPLAITRTAFNVTISGLQNLANPDDLAATKAAIAAGLDEFLRSREPFIVGLSILPRSDRITLVALGAVIEDIVGAAGGTVTTVSFTSSVDTAFTLGKGQKAKLGTVTYV